MKYTNISTRSIINTQVNVQQCKYAANINTQTNVVLLRLIIELDYTKLYFNKERFT